MFLHLSVSHSVHGVGLPQCMLGYTPSPPGADPPGAYPPPTVHAGRCGQQAGVTHSTGMYTCFTTEMNFYGWCTGVDRRDRDIVVAHH